MVLLALCSACSFHFVYPRLSNVGFYSGFCLGFWLTQALFCLPPPPPPFPVSPRVLLFVHLFGSWCRLSFRGLLVCAICLHIVSAISCLPGLRQDHLPSVICGQGQIKWHGVVPAGCVVTPPSATVKTLTSKRVWPFWFIRRMTAG